MYGQNYPTQNLNDFRQSNGSYSSNQLGYAGGGISGAPGFGTNAQGYGGAGFGSQAAMAQHQVYQGPAYQGSAYQGPAYQGSAYQGPAYQGPAYQGPAYQGSAYQGPAYQGPAYQGPAYQRPAYQGFGYGNQASLGYQGTGWGQQMGTGGIMNSAAQNLQSNFPGLYSGVMGNWVQTRPDVYGFQGQPQYMTQNQLPQTSYQGQNVLNNFQQTRGDYGMGTTMGTTMGSGFGGSIMNSAAGTLQSNLGNLRGNVLNDWSLTSPENQNELLSQQRQLGTYQAGTIPAGLQAQMMQTQPYNQQNTIRTQG